jgi:hypothetical protein
MPWFYGIRGIGSKQSLGGTMGDETMMEGLKHWDLGLMAWLEVHVNICKYL